MPPDFSSLAYWQTRFLTTEPPSGFEWLSAPSALEHLVLEWRASLPPSSSPPRVLHIGSGTSSLSNSLRTWLSPSLPPSRILNVDFAESAVAWGRAKELEVFGSSEGESGMSWATVDLLLPLPSYLPPSYSLIIEKSTSDALSCGPLSPLDGTTEPLTILVRNMARVCREGATWLALSYSSDRFPRENLGGLWDVERVVKVKARSGREDKEEEEGAKEKVVVGVPMVEHGIYVLRRTGRGLGE